MTILPSTYLPRVGYMRHIVKGDYIIDLGENYIKRSDRNRTEIMTANGVMQLTVNIRNANRPRVPMHQIEIDYSKRWQHQHWMAIVSAYKSSPYFDYYADMLEGFYREECSSLTEYNSAFLTLILRMLSLPENLNISNEYVVATECDIDLRAKGAEFSEKSLTPYIQVFSDRHPFAEDLSILDLLLCEGPNAISYLM